MGLLIAGIAFVIALAAWLIWTNRVWARSTEEEKEAVRDEMRYW